MTFINDHVSPSQLAAFVTYIQNISIYMMVKTHREIFTIILDFDFSFLKICSRLDTNSGFLTMGLIFNVYELYSSGEISLK